jgi:hypothetical protein
MPTPIEQLQQAGFSESEIGDWAKTQRTSLTQAGFGDDEIDHWMGGPKPGVEGFLKRVSNAIDPVRVLSQAGQDFWKGFKEGGGMQPALTPEQEEEFRRYGLLYLAQPIAAAGKVSTGVLHGLAEAVPPIGGPLLAAAEAFPAGHLAGAPTFSGGAPIWRLKRDPDGNIQRIPVGDLPEAQDFSNAAQAVGGPNAPSVVREKLEQLWQDKGIHPAEVAHDVERDPTIAQDLLATGGHLPEAYGPHPREDARGSPGSGLPIETEAGTPSEQPARTRPEEVSEASAVPLRSFSPGELKVDPERFQFKADTGEAGVSERLQGITQWDPLKAGLALVYEDQDGSHYIADGHQRLGLAKRIQDADPIQQPKLNAWVLRAADGVTDAEVRAVAASKNIAEGTGTPVDAAKVLRDRPDLLPSLPPRSELVRQAQGLTNLDPEAFGKVVNEVVPANQAAIVGRLAPEDGAMQNALIDLLAKTAPDNAVQAEAIVRQGLEAGIRKETQQTLFGPEEIASSLYLERAKILDRALKQLRRDRTVFQTIVDNSSIIEQLGNRLAQDENTRRAVTDGQAVQILQTLAHRRGPIGDALTGAARGYASGSTDLAAAARDVVAEIRRQAQGGALHGLADGGSRSDVAIAGKTAEPAATPALDRTARDVGPTEEARVNEQVQQAIRAYHGTPHTFEPEPGAPYGRFRLEKAGTGEGGAAFGHGIYLAEEPKVAEGYQMGAGDNENVGNLYEVYIKAPTEHFLDWDKPVSEQPHVLDALEKLGIEEPPKTTSRGQIFGGWASYTGGDVYGRLQSAAWRKMFPDEPKGSRMTAPEETSKALSEVGIAGIRYLDQLSRDLADSLVRNNVSRAKAEAHAAVHQTHNFVVFDPKDIEITGRNGEKLPVQPTIEKTAQGDQLVIPGAEQSAQQAMAAREAEGHGKIAPQAPQQEPGGLFETPKPEEPDLFRGPQEGTPPAGMGLGAPEPVRTPAEQAILDRISVGEATDKRPWSWSRLYTAVFDKLHPIEIVTKGEELPVTKDPYRLARLTAGTAGRVEGFLKYGTRDWTTGEINGESLQAVLAPVLDDLDGFRAFAAAARALELEARDIETGLNLSAARQVAAAGQETYGPILTRLIAYQDRTAQYLRDSGVLSAAGYDAMRDANRLYVPFNRVIGDEPGGAGGGSLQPSNPIHRIKGSQRQIVDPIESIMRNTNLNIAMAERNAAGTALVDLLRQNSDAHGAIGDVSTAHPREVAAGPIEHFPEPERGWSAAAVKDAKQPDLFPERGPVAAEEAVRPAAATLDETISAAIRDALHSEGLSDELFDFMSNAIPPREGEIAIFRDGKREVWQVGTDIAEAVKALDQDAANLLVRMLAMPARLLRAGATLSPDFMLRNPVRDFMSAFVQTSVGVFHPLRSAKGLYSAIVKDEHFQDWLAHGGGNATLVAMDRRYLQENLRDLTEEAGLQNRAWNVVRHPIEALRTLSEYSEQMTRLGEFRAVRDKELADGATPKDAALSAAYASREVTIDFARMGAKTRSMNMITAFFNAQLQGSDRLVRAIRDDPVKTGVRIAAGITLPSVLLWWVNHDDPDYQELPGWQRDLFWIIPVGSAPPSPLHVQQAQERGEVAKPSAKFFMRWPKPFETGVLFGSGIERLLEAFVRENPDAWSDFSKSVMGALLPSFVPTAVLPIAEQWANRSSFTDRTLIPAQVEKQLPEYQYQPYTTETAKQLGQLIAAFPGMREAGLGNGPIVSGVARALSTPILLENYLRGWSGGLGGYALQIVDAGLRKNGIVPDPPKPADTLADIPVVKAFIVRHPSGGAESVQRFYDDYERNKKFFDTWKAKAEEGDTAALARIEMAGGPRLFVQLDGIHQALGEHSKLIRDITKDPDMRPEEKRQLIDQLYFSEIQIAQSGRQQMAQIDKSLAGVTLH